VRHEEQPMAADESELHELVQATIRSRPADRVPEARRGGPTGIDSRSMAESTGPNPMGRTALDEVIAPDD
jgi:hypothetical protein